MLIVASCGHAADCSGYAADLAAMTRADQAVREAVDWTTFEQESKPSPAIQHVLLIDRVNTARLQDWIDRCGWPRRSVQGEAAVGAAWLLAQHADMNPAFQARALEHVRAAVAAGEESASDLAYLTDRLAVAAGKPQEYGTQGSIQGDCVYEFSPMDDPGKVEARRKKLGWPSLEEYRRLVLREFFKGRCGGG
jgi:hypothetical protein